MANNFLQFSEVLIGLTEEEADWICALADAARQGEGTPETRGVAEFIWGAEEEYIEAFKEKCDEHGNFHVWFRSEESGNPQAVGECVRAFFNKFRPNGKDAFTLSWAEWCDKLRVGEFGGGAMVVTKDDIHMFGVYEWTNQKLKELGLEEK